MKLRNIGYSRMQEHHGIEYCVRAVEMHINDTKQQLSARGRSKSKYRSKSHRRTKQSSKRTSTTSRKMSKSGRGNGERKH